MCGRYLSSCGLPVTGVRVACICRLVVDQVLRCEVGICCIVVDQVLRCVVCICRLVDAPGSVVVGDSKQTSD